jgi:hypothetical protein
MVSDSYPDDMPGSVKLQLRQDVALYGVSYVELTDEGYRRIDPTSLFKIEK